MMTPFEVTAGAVIAAISTAVGSQVAIAFRASHRESRLPSGRLLTCATFLRRQTLIVLFYLRSAGFYVAVAFVGDADDAFWCYLAAGYFEGCRDRAVLEEAFALAECDRDYHQFHRVDEIVFEERLTQIRASHYLYIGSVLLFEILYFLGNVAA